MQKADILDDHAFIYGFQHVVNCEQAGLHGSQCFHFHTGLADGFDAGAADDSGRFFLQVEINSNMGERQRMAQGNEVACPLGTHDGCCARDANYVSFFGCAGSDAIPGGLPNENGSFCGCCAACIVFAGNINHMCLAFFIEMGQRLVFGGDKRHGMGNGKKGAGYEPARENGYHNMMGKKCFFREKRMSAFCRMVLLPLLFLLAWQPAVYAQYSNLPTMGDAAQGELSPLMEYRIGVEIMRRIQGDPDYIEDDVVTEYLNAVGYKLVHATPEVLGEAGNDFFFFALRDPTLNAFALPGGFIGVHTGLLLAAQSESELASVLSHEIGHVSQRHIARMIGNQKQDMLIPIASLVLAAIAGASKNMDAAGALAVGGQGLAVQKQLNFNRDAEREADRIGFLILRGGGFDTNGMVSFFERLQRANRNYGEGVSAYLRTHPLTSERIADIEARVQSESYRQHADTPDFYYVRIRAQLLQDGSVKGLETAAAGFQEMIRTGGRYLVSAGYYGQALLALKQNDPAQAMALLQKTRELIGEKAAQRSLALTATSIDIKTASRQYAEAAREAQAALSRFPSSRALSYQYASVLYHAKEYDKALAYLRRQAQLYRNDAMIQDMLAKVYGAQGKIALMHLALAESYSLSGGLSSALEQLSLARQAPDVTFYDHSIIDAREREWQKQRLEELADR